MSSLQIAKAGARRLSSPSWQPPRLVICGSMGIFGMMLSLARELETNHVPVVVPEADTVDLHSLPIAHYEAHKRKASKAHFKAIMHPSTFAVVAANFDRNGMPDYVGTNTFAELAVAFAHGKKIFLLQGFPDSFSDELKAWGAVPLHGDRGALVNQYRGACLANTTQPALF